MKISNMGMTLLAWLVLWCSLPLGEAAILTPGGGIRAPTRGPCSTTFVTITVNTEADLASRTKYPNTTTAILLIAANITLTSPLLLGPPFSCTIMRAHASLSYTPWLWSSNVSAPAVRVFNASNIHVIGVGIGFPWNYTVMPACAGLPEFPARWTCPVLHLYRAYAVTFSNGYVYGRTDVYRSGAVYFSYMSLYADFWDTPPTLFSYATIRFALCGDPVNLIRSLNRVTNSEIRGSWTSVMLYAGAVGVIIANNNIRDFQFSGIQCGMGDSNVADCMLNTLQDNYISAISTVYPTPHPDGSGIYYDLHWYNPGNMDSCNYMVGGTHCYYLDYTTSGVTIDGAVCLRNHDGVKINTGHANKITSVLVVAPEWQSGIMSCQSWCDNNCNAWAGRGLGSKWYQTYISKFETPAWRNTWPYLADLCSRTSWNGVKCNPSPPVQYATNWTGYCSGVLDYTATGKQLSASANMSANCSGVPGLNHVQMIVINGTNKRWDPYYINCDALPSVKTTNNITSTTANYPFGYFKFDDEKNGDFGISDLSNRVYQMYPKFLSCNRPRVGIQRQAKAQAAAMDVSAAGFSREPSDWLHNTFNAIPAGQVSTAVKVDLAKFRARTPRRG